MKNVFLLLFIFISLFSGAQPYSSLLKDVDWTITKIVKNGTEYLPPYPFEQAGKADFNYDSSNAFKSSFFNTAVGTVDFGANNAAYFYAQISGITLAQYDGVNEQLVNQFDAMTTNFYFGFQPTDQFNFVYEQIFSGKNLVVTNPLGNKIFYSNLILGNNESTFNKEISIFPNPAKNKFFLKSLKNNVDQFKVEIIDASGQLVSTQKISSSNSVNTENLPNGNYVIKVDISGTQHSLKLMIKK